MKTTNTEGTFYAVLMRTALAAKTALRYWNAYQEWETDERMRGIGLELSDHLDSVIAMQQELLTRWERREVRNPDEDQEH